MPVKISKQAFSNDELTGDITDERWREDTVKNKPRKMAQLKQRHEDVYGGQRRTQSL